MQSTFDSSTSPLGSDPQAFWSVVLSIHNPGSPSSRLLKAARRAGCDDDGEDLVTSTIVRVFELAKWPEMTADELTRYLFVAVKNAVHYWLRQGQIHAGLTSEYLAGEHPSVGSRAIARPDDDGDGATGHLQLQIIPKVLPGEETLDDALRAAAAQLAPTHPDAEKIVLLMLDGHSRTEVKAKLGHASYSRIDLTLKAARALLPEWRDSVTNERRRTRPRP